MPENLIPFVPRERIELEHELLERLDDLTALRLLVEKHGADQIRRWLWAIATVEQGLDWPPAPLAQTHPLMPKPPVDCRD